MIDIKDDFLEQVTKEDGDRYYEDKRNKKKYKSVTTLISWAKPKGTLTQWRNRVGIEEANRITKEASTRGNTVHKFIEEYFANSNFSNEDIYFQKMLPVLNIITPYLVEKKVHWTNGDRGFAGSVDICGDIDTSNLIKRETGRFTEKNIIAVADNKTWNSAKYPRARTQGGVFYSPLISYYLQLSAYCAAINQSTEGKYRINQAFIFGVTATCKQPFIYYLNSDCMKFYWSKMKELVDCFYEERTFDWNSFEREADALNLLGERVDIIL